ncbi:MAG: fold metallo-hydrolase [Nocardioides sp.]|jgi:cyclase|nr:fold metallo-hydrolase [Nocardioides sp.]
MSSSVEDHPDLGDARLVEVSENIFAYLQPDGSWWINNAGFFVGKNGVVSIDGCSTAARTNRYIETIATVSSKPVHTLVNTHHHGDHTFGNYLFDSATILGHEKTREDVLHYGLPFDAPIFESVEWGPVELAPPFVTYQSEVKVWVDDLPVELSYVGQPAHTTNDSIVWVPDRSVLFVGDLLFNGGTPFLLMGSVAGAIEVLENVIKPIPATTIVPGHGDVCGPELIDDVLDYLRFVMAVAEDGVRSGVSPLEAARETQLGRFAHLLDPERIVGNLHRAYAELNGAAPGARIDTRAALAEMVTYNGGRRLTCYA